jgi:hypothetical protein
MTDDTRTLAGDEYTCNGWACTDCMILFANGDVPGGMSESEIEEWQSRIDECTAGYRITLGMLAEDHVCAVNYTVTDLPGADRMRVALARFARKHMPRVARLRWLAGTDHEYRADDENDAIFAHEFHNWEPIIAVTAHDLTMAEECECERDTFSWSACDTCNGNPGGERHAVSFWKITEPS